MRPFPEGGRTEDCLKPQTFKDAALLELDLRELLQQLRRTQFIGGDDAFDPHKRSFLNLNHYLVCVDEGILLQALDLLITTPIELRTAREDFVVFQFTKSASYRRQVGSDTSIAIPGTVQITNFPEVIINYSSSVKNPIVGITIMIKRDCLTDGFGLRFDHFREPYRSIFASRLGSPSTLQIPIPSNIWIVVNDILACRMTGPGRFFYLRAKAIEAICLVVEHLNTLKRPPSLGGISPLELQRQQLEAAAAIYRRQLYKPPSTRDLAASVGLSHNQLVTGFVEQFGSTPHDYSVKQRMAWAKSQIALGMLNLKEISSTSGYTTYSAFSRAFHDHFGFPPSQSKASTASD
jgi:AraC-like DNA-binding protein